MGLKSEDAWFGWEVQVIPEDYFFTYDWSSHPADW
ncbi:predicted protein [Sclerotinia sclerotiorum 1980 UF-70]|uniref:Uncharacterized protein n=1 Tax=Sclerotinia sclerotiorum (strain ATCC 18683 / 1980 / Ss-1) TaxID=665079 RepID=A7E614_SCLS1|nr:predicted protein [Sclerotinia sclerotiorum 1980 UF-70]EDN91336.1 predicted protein [Sclerotinia sclerotiorum 1980 UF-70]